MIGLEDPRPAPTRSPAPGSPAVSKVTEAEDPPDARVSATVRGAGKRRTLAYDVAARPDQRVTFVETSPEGNRPLGTVRGGKGTLTFAPAPGGGRRQIEAQFELDGVRAETRTVASFSPPSVHLGRPSRVASTAAARGCGSAGRASRAPSVRAVTSLATGGQRVTSHAQAQRGHRRHHPRERRAGHGARGCADASRCVRSARFRAAGRAPPTRFGPLPRLPRR